jgi:VIT1/CCC1 family predicted Fe2+/Mn2+ transporter
MAITVAEFREVKTKVDCHDDRIQEHSAQIESLSTEVSEHDKWINGNGVPGAKVTLALLNERWEQLDDTIKKIDKKSDKIFNTMLSGLITIAGAFLGLLVYLIQMHIK